MYSTEYKRKSKTSSPLENVPPSERIPVLAAIIASIEIFAGSLLHGLKVPFGGNFLSLVQAAFLTLASRSASSRLDAVKLPFYISSISSCLKSLSPAGNKLGPMLSIWMQGVLFSGGVGLFGKNPVGTAVGGALLSLWAFVQPFLTLYLFFGDTLFEAGSFYLDKMQAKLGVGSEELIFVLTTVVAVKALLSVLICGVFVPLFEQRILRYSFKSFAKHKKEIYEKIVGRQKSSDHKSIFLLAVKDMLQPFVLFSFFLGIVFLVFSTSSYAKMIWLSLRPLAIAYLFFVFCRSSFLYGLPKKLGRIYLFQSFASLFDRTVGVLLTDKLLDQRIEGQKKVLK